MAKIKKISINAMDKIAKDNHNLTTPVNWNGLEIIVKKFLPLKEMLGFVDSVTKTCFPGDNNNYVPEVKDFAIKSNILERYANFNLPNNLDHRYELIYATDAVDIVLKQVDMQQFNEILKAIDAKVNHIAQANIEAINKQMNELYSAFNTLQTNMENMFSGIDPDNFNALINAFGNGEINESKIVEAYLANTPEN